MVNIAVSVTIAVAISIAVNNAIVVAVAIVIADPNFNEMCHSDRCWKTARVARAQLEMLGSEATRLKAKKD